MNYRILLAEDDPQITEIISDYFSEKTDECTELVCVPDGRGRIAIRGEAVLVAVSDVVAQL